MASRCSSQAESLVAGALQAARGLPARGLLVEAQLDLVEAVALGDGQHRHRAARVVGERLGADVEERGPVPLQARARARRRPPPGISPDDVGVDGDGGPSAGGDGFHHGGRAGLAVASGEDALAAGEQGQLVGRDGAPGGQRRRPRPGRSPSTSWPMARITVSAGDGELRAGDRLRPPPAAVVGLAQRHLLADHPDHPAVARATTEIGEVRSRGRRLPPRPRRPRRRWPASPRACAGRPRVTSSAPRRSADRAASMAVKPPPITSVLPQRLVPVAGVALAQEVHRRVDALGLFGAGDAAGRAALGADGQIDGVVTLRPSRLSMVKSSPSRRVQPQFDPQARGCRRPPRR